MKLLAVAIACSMLLTQSAVVYGQRADPGLKGVADAATDIIVADVLETNPRKAIEGARDTVQLRVVRTLKGPRRPGEMLGVYYHLLWIDTKKWILEPPKFEKGKRYTVFAAFSLGYTLADQWVAVLPDHPRLDDDIEYALNEVGDLWNGTAAPSRLRIEIDPDAKVAQTKQGLILPIKITNHSTKEVTSQLAHEWHGGEWPATDLYASATPVTVKKTINFQPVYVAGDEPGETKETRIAPGQTLTVNLRMDWAGTGSVRGDSIMSQAHNEYFVRLLLVFDTGDKRRREHAVSAKKYVRFAPK